MKILFVFIFFTSSIYGQKTADYFLEKIPPFPENICSVPYQVLNNFTQKIDTILQELQDEYDRQSLEIKMKGAYTSIYLMNTDSQKMIETIQFVNSYSDPEAGGFASAFLMIQKKFIRFDIEAKNDYRTNIKPLYDECSGMDSSMNSASVINKYSEECKRYCLQYSMKYVLMVSEYLNYIKADGIRQSKEMDRIISEVSSVAITQSQLNLVENYLTKLKSLDEYKIGEQVE